MYNFPIGVMLESFNKSIPESLAIAQKMGAQGIQVYATYGDLSPKKLVGQARKDFLNMVKDHGLKISALCGDLGHGFGNTEENPQLIEDSKRILDLAKELEVPFVVGVKLPGNFSPDTAGRAIAESVLRLIAEAKAE